MRGCEQLSVLGSGPEPFYEEIQRVGVEAVEAVVGFLDSGERRLVGFMQCC